MKEPYALGDNANVLGMALFLKDVELIEKFLKGQNIQKKYSEQTLKEASMYLRALILRGYL
jgi:hypothetical protein